ncbi:hypothetical protein [Bacillus altitudinis]|uniref:hypothetical protein n=1 Tax=Bacillus altitudinis TaxID=293387 RepID=UPI002281B7BE|nr:hypothetical protein [Bacillus altitudinis]MCY7454305.1 hypothetical protein [Bacillus altitudinis]
MKMSWVEGKLVIRGKKKDLIRFLTDGFASLYLNDHMIESRDDVFRMNTHHGLEILGTTDLFVSIYGEVTEISLDTDDDDDYVVVNMELETADKIIAEELLMVAKKFNIDFRAVATNIDWKFSQHVLIMNGNIVKDETININIFEFNN